MRRVPRPPGPSWKRSSATWQRGRGRLAHSHHSPVGLAGRDLPNLAALSCGPERNVIRRPDDTPTRRPSHNCALVLSRGDRPACTAPPRCRTVGPSSDRPPRPSPAGSDSSPRATPERSRLILVTGLSGNPPEADTPSSETRWRNCERRGEIRTPKGRKTGTSGSARKAGASGESSSSSPPDPSSQKSPEKPNSDPKKREPFP